MKKIYAIVFSLAALSLSAGVFTGCQSDVLDTAQYTATGVKLVSYGPNPVMRGGALTFKGSNLDRIVEVQVPGVEPITTIEVISSGLQSEIRVILPAEGPEVGTITLKSSDGVTLTTKTELEYTEPIVLESFSTKTTPAFAGDELALKGDYMNLVKSVTFEGGEVAEVVPGDRHNATVIIPSTAVTGKIILSDEGEIANLIYSETDLRIGDPTVSGVKAAGAVKPGVEITLSGAHLDMIEFVDFGEVRVDTEDILYAEDGKTLKVSLPAEAASCEVAAVSYAGKSFKAGKITTVVPSEVKAPADAVKNGDEITITGKDLDLVTSISFPSAAADSFTANKEGTSIAVTVPMTATAGDIKLSLANGDEVTAAYSLVKATLTGIVLDEGATEVTAGKTFSVTGTDLDLIESATLGGKTVEIAVANDGLSAVITTSSSSVTGKVVLTQYNGETLESTEEVKIVYDSYIIVSSMPSEAHIGELVTLNGENFMMIENIYVGDAKVVAYGNRSDSELSFVMPFNKVGTYSIKFNLLSGESEICPTQIGVLLEQTFTTIWNGTFAAGNWGGNQDLAWGGYDWSKVTAGQTLRFTLEQDATATYWQLALRHGDNWGELPEKVQVDMTAGQTIVDVVLSQTAIDDLVAHNGLVITGCNYTLTKVELIGEISQEVDIWTGTFAAGNWGGNQDLAWGGYDWSTVKAGQSLVLYLTTDASSTYWQVELRHGQNWENLPDAVHVDLTADQTRVEIPLTQSNIDDLVANGGLVLTGCYYTLTKVALL